MLEEWIMDAQSYYQSLLAQGYTPSQAQQYTAQHYPGFTVASAPPLTQPPTNTTIPLHQNGLPLPTHIVETPQIEPVNGGKNKRIKTASIALVALLIVGGGTAGILYVIGSDDVKDASFVGEWIDESGYITKYNGDNTFDQYPWWKGEPGGDSPFTTSWDKSGDEVSTTFEYPVTSAEFPYVEKTNFVMEIEIIGNVMFMNILETSQIREYDDGEIVEEDMSDDLQQTCFALVSKKNFDFSGEQWNEEAHDKWYAMVDSAEKPSWCDTEFKSEYVFSFSKTDNFFEITLEKSKWEKLSISDLEFFISINGGSEIECFYDGYDGVCSYIPQFGSEELNPGAVISFGRAEEWNTDCSNGCDIDIRIVLNPDNGTILIDEINQTNLVWEDKE